MPLGDSKITGTGSDDERFRAVELTTARNAQRLDDQNGDIKEIKEAIKATDARFQAALSVLDARMRTLVMSLLLASISFLGAAASIIAVLKA